MRCQRLKLIVLSILMTVYLLGGCPNLLQAYDVDRPSDNLASTLTSTLENVSKMNQSDMSSLLGAVGASESKSIDMAKICGYFIFGGIGFVAFVYGKKNSFFKPMVIGIVLNVYPYFMASTLLIYIVGIILTAALFMWRD